MPFPSPRRSGFVVVAAALAAACATQPGDPCNTGQVALIGAIAGAVLGSATAKDKNRQGDRALTGAAAGGALGALACVAINASSRQTKSATAANEEVRRRTGSMPPAASLVAYESAVEPATARPGSNVVVKTMVEVVDGSREPVNDLRETLTLRDTEGKEHRLKEKTVGDGAARAGRFENSFTFQLPRGVSQGVYGIKTQIILNGQVTAEREAKMQLVERSGAPIEIARLDPVSPR